MQTQGGTAATTAIEDTADRRIRWRFNVDWNGNGAYSHALSSLATYVQSATVDRALKGSAPADIMLIEGSSAAKLSVILAGRDSTSGLEFDAVFSPYNGNSPLYGKNQIGSECTFDIGVDTVLGTVWYPQFVGNISSIDIDRESGEVEITALDRVEKLRKPVILAPWAVSEYWNNYGRTEAQKADTQNFIQNCLQLCDTSATKYRPTYKSEMGLPDTGTIDGVGIFVPFAGGMVPTIGWIDNAAAETYPTNDISMYQAMAQPHPSSPVQTQKPYALTAMGSNTDGNVLKYWVANRDNTRTEGAHYIGFQLSTASGFPNSTYWQTAPDHAIVEYRSGGKYVIGIRCVAGKMYVQVRNENTGVTSNGTQVTIPTGQESVEVSAVVNIGQDKGVRSYLRCNSNATILETIGPNFNPSDYPLDELQGWMQVWHRVGLFNVFYGFRNFGFSASTSPPDETLGGWRPAKYAAILDQGLNSMSYTPNVNGQDAWDVITELAAAEFGSVFWDESGVFRFWNYNTVKSKQDAPVRKVSLADLKGLEISNSLDSVRNIYSVQAGKNIVLQTRVFESESLDQFIIPGQTTKDFIIAVDNVQFTEPRRLPRHTTIPLGTPTGNQFLQWSDDWSHHGYVMQLDYGAGGWHEPDYINVTLEIYTFFNDQGQMVIRVRNPWAETARLAVSDGDGRTASANNKPALRIDGTLIKKGDVMTLRTSDLNSIQKYGPRNYEAKGDWYQQSYNDEGLMNVLLPRTSKPIPTTQNVEMVGDPRIQLGDTFSLVDPEGLGEQMRIQIFGITRKLTKRDGLTDVYSVELIRPTALGIWDSTQYGRWDQSLIWN